mgnify:CR=1 FL=1
MKHPGPAKDYKKQDLNSRSSSNWGWLYAYVTRFPDHENVQRLKKWSQNKSNLNSYQWDIVHHYLNIEMVDRGYAWYYDGGSKNKDLNQLRAKRGPNG